MKSCFIDTGPDVAGRQGQRHYPAIHRPRRADEYFVNHVRAHCSVSPYVFAQRLMINGAGLCRDVPVFAFSVDLGTIKSTSSPVTWSIGYVRDPSVLYTTGSGTTEMRRPYYATHYSNISTIVSTLHILCGFDGNEYAYNELDRRRRRGRFSCARPRRRA